MSIYVIIFLLIAFQIKCDYLISTFNITDFNPLSYNLSLEGSAKLDIFSLNFNENCNLNLNFSLSTNNYLNIELSLYKQVRFSYLLPRNFYSSPGYRSDYYISSNNIKSYDVTNNNPFRLLTVYNITSTTNNPYDLSIYNPEDNICFPGIKMFNNTMNSSQGFIHLHNKGGILYGFDFYLDYIALGILESTSDYSLSILFHNCDVSKFATEYYSNSHFCEESLNFTISHRSDNYKNDMNNFFKLEISTIKKNSAFETLYSSDLEQLNNLKLYSFQLLYSLNKNLNDCFYLNLNIVHLFPNDNDNPSQNNSFLQIFINNNLVLCLIINLRNYINTDDIYTLNTFSIMDGLSVGKSFVTLIASSYDNTNLDFLLIMKSIKFITNPLCNKTSSEMILFCDLNALNLYPFQLKIISISTDYNESITIYYTKNTYDYYKKCNHNSISSYAKIFPGIDNPFYEKCYSVLKYTYGTNDIVIKNNQAISFNLKKIFNFDTNLKFIPEEIHNICVYSKNAILNVGYCDCRICIKLFNLAKAFSVFNNYSCRSLFTDVCNCFEQSNVDKSGNGYVYQSYSICTECKFDSHCSLNLKQAKCNRPSLPLKINQPVVKTINPLTDENISIDFGRVPNGEILGDTCDCNYFDRNKYPYTSLKNNRFLYNIYHTINPLNEDFNFRHCVLCLYENPLDESTCTICNDFKVANLDYYTLPGGGSNCRDCVYSGEYLQSIQTLDRNSYIKIVKCIDDSKNNYFLACSSLIKSLNYDSSLIFIGLLSNFRVECPGRLFKDYGSVCIPWYGFNQLSKYTILFKRSKLTQWSDDFQCININCEPSIKDNCGTLEECVCFDTCPLGKAKFPFINKSILVPCSGNGVCSNNSGCICDWGYLKPNCELHCSQTEGGCCTSDEDCIFKLGFTKCSEISNDIGVCRS